MLVTAPAEVVPLGVMAPPQKPAALKLLNGRGPGKDSAGREVKVVPHDRTPPTKPEIVELDQDASDEWDRIVPGLDALQILKPQDRAILTAYCLTWSEYVSARYDVEREGTVIYVTVRGADGDSTRKPIPNPSYKIMAERQTTLLKFAREFGLTPSSEASAWNGKADEGQGAGSANPFANGSTG